MSQEKSMRNFAAGWSGARSNRRIVQGKRHLTERYVDPEGTAIMKKISSTDAFDSAEKHCQVLQEWQNTFLDKAFIFQR